ncbi:Tolloid-like protein 1 [Trichinella patagoniensis]|uniref:Metalloendopeptidase n=1 Tax=Trichinella patagoniensis TaxID=990121 RepID=A0A0V0ZIY0_9BILA|nr:Tolloid-like protein 1 [Trichinella patagoniensis]
MVIMNFWFLISVSLFLFNTSDSLREGDCEVCIKFLEKFISKCPPGTLTDIKKLEGFLKKTCASTGGKDHRFCYYIGALPESASNIMNEVVKPLSWSMPPEKVCERLKQKDGQICELRYDKSIDWKTVDLNKLRVKELKKILDDWGEVCKACTEKSEFVSRIKELMPTHLHAKTNMEELNCVLACIDIENRFGWTARTRNYCGENILTNFLSPTDKAAWHFLFDRIFNHGISNFPLFVSLLLAVVGQSRKWTMDELLTLRFPYLSSNDLYLDVCKAGGFLADIALTHEEVNEIRHLRSVALSKTALAMEDHQHHQKKKKKTMMPTLVAQSNSAQLQKLHRRHHSRSCNNDDNKNSSCNIKRRNRKRVRRAATARSERLWENGVIPYEILANFSGEHHALFRRAMNHWENYTCLSFVPRTSEDFSYIVFTIADCGCCSFVGKRGEGPQAISIGKNCDKFGIVVHELGHVVGFWHEHTRPDRDQFVDIFYKNIQQGQDYNFEKLKSSEVNSLGQGYDFASIMHYARDTFSRAMYLDTILPKPDSVTLERPEIGQRIRLSPGDIIQTNSLYKCSKCGQTFLEESGSFASPDYDSKAKHNDALLCHWRINAPKGHRIILNLTSVLLPENVDCGPENSIEVRDGHHNKSPLIGRYCGRFNEPILISSESNRLWIQYQATAEEIPKKNLLKEKKKKRGFAAVYHVHCGGNFTADSGVIENPNYPYDYTPNSDCVWTITVPEEYQVAIIFTMFQLEQHEDCIYDFLEFRDGHDEDSPLIARLCGYSLPENIKSTTNKMRVRFVSDASVEKYGFSFNFIKEFDECKTTNHGCHHKCVNTLGSYRCECDIGYELHSDGKSCEDACGGYLKGENGSLTSPNFPNLYPNKKRCVWEIKAHSQYRIFLNFTHFDLEGVLTNCEYDYVKVTSVDAEGAVAKVHGQFCGRIAPQFLLTSETSHLRIKFVTDSSVQKSGFAAVYFTDRDECEVDNGGCEQICKNMIGSYVCECESGYVLSNDGHHCKEGPSGGCKFELNTAFGQLTSPGYPEDYPNDKECVWHFVTTPGHRLQLDFIEFEIEPHQDCAYDRIDVYDGSSVDAPSLGTYCGPRAPEKILSSKNELYLFFHSDSSVQRKGFQAHYTSVCGGTIRAERTVGYVYSHATYGGSNYENRVACEWTLLAEDGMSVEIQFTNFELEEEVHCEYDYVEIYDGDSENAMRLGRYCGNKQPNLFISSGPVLRVRFRADDTVTAKGFVFEYVETDPVEGLIYTEEPGPTTRPPLEPVINEKANNRFLARTAAGRRPHIH